MDTDFFRELWNRLANNKGYRKQFVSAQAKRAFAFQLRAIMKKRGLSQEKLAEQSGLTQGVISRAADPNYGTLTTTVIVKIANGLDMAYLGVLVPYSDAAKWFLNLSEEFVQVPTFEEENSAFGGSLGPVEPHTSSEKKLAASDIAMERESQYGVAEILNNYSQNVQPEAA